MDEAQDRLPSETLSHIPAGQIPFGEMLKLMDRFHEADRQIEAKIEVVEERRRALAGELHMKIDGVKEGLDDDIDELMTRTVTLESDKKSFQLQVQDVKDRLDKLEEGGKDEFANIVFFLRPSYIKAMGVAVAAVVLGVAGAWYAVQSRGGLEEKPEKPEKPAIEAPAEPGDKPIGGLFGADADAVP